MGNLTVATHNGVFHADDAMAIAILQLMYHGNLQVVRTRDQEKIDRATFAVDVGGEYIHGQSFDHHQPDFHESWMDGTPMASAGLVWREFGERACLRILEGHNPNKSRVIEVAKRVGRDFIKPIDAVDNGVPGAYSYVSELIARMRPTFLQKQSMDEAFEVAELEASQALYHAVQHAYADQLAEDVVTMAQLDALDRQDQILRFDHYVPWVTLDIHKELLYTVFQANSGTWMVQQIPTTPGGKIGRKPLPAEWAGLNGEDLAQVTGVEDAVFCHKGRFIAGATSEQGALALANLALKS